MPVILNSNSSSYERQPCANGLCAKPTAECVERASRVLTIGLINNMPDAALEATERQFLSLLGSASDGFSVRLQMYSLPDVPRNKAGARHVSDHYSSVENLWDKQLDGLIVTGREPLTPNLADEPYWESFTRVIEWARSNTYSTVWSCLAAHAAVLAMDGVSRIRNGHKHSGVFDCALLYDHPLMTGAPLRFKLPHSRWNGMPADQLTARGYRVLTQAADAGVDTFIKQCKSLFVFFQGHPEYESNTLLLEYRRDVGRYFRGETDTYPLMPRDYFDCDTVAALASIQHKCGAGRSEELLAEACAILEKARVENAWQSTATGIYKNWLQYICAQKKLRLQNNMADARAYSTDRFVPPPAKTIEMPHSSVQAMSLGQAPPRLLRAAR